MKRLLVLLVVLSGVISSVALLTQVGAAQSGPAACEDGMADGYPCRNVDLLAHLPLDAMGGGEASKGSDHWGWTDPETGRDFVIFGLTDGTSFVEITDRTNPVYLGTLPSHDGASVWRDIKVYQNVAYITADIPTNHGLQLFDLTRLRDVADPPVVFDASGHYDGFGPGHNLWVNADSGYLYVFRSDTCGGEIHMIDVREPLNPQFAGCFEASDAPLSDSECVMYSGPDGEYHGRELCFTGSDDNVTIGDVTDKNNPQIVADFTYPGIARAHQGALTPDQRYWLLSDTMDEMMAGHNTRTIVIDVADIDAPEVVGYYEHATTARDHNVYIVGTLAFQTNWQAGLRVLDLRRLPETDLLEVAYFDIVPESDSIAMSGAWSHYPWWGDGVVTVSGTEGGLFVLQTAVAETHVPLVMRP